MIICILKTISEQDEEGGLSAGYQSEEGKHNIKNIKKHTLIEKFRVAKNNRNRGGANRRRAG